MGDDGREENGKRTRDIEWRLSEESGRAGGRTNTDLVTVSADCFIRSLMTRSFILTSSRTTRTWSSAFAASCALASRSILMLVISLLWRYNELDRDMPPAHLSTF